MFCRDSFKRIWTDQALNFRSFWSDHLYKQWHIYLLFVKISSQIYSIQPKSSPLTKIMVSKYSFLRNFYSTKSTLFFLFRRKYETKKSHPLKDIYLSYQNETDICFPNNEWYPLYPFPIFTQVDWYRPNNSGDYPLTSGNPYPQCFPFS